MWFFLKNLCEYKIEVWTNNTNTTIISFYLDAPNISRRTLLSLVAENGEDVAKNERANENDFSRAKTSLSRRSSIDRQRAKVNCFELFFLFQNKNNKLVNVLVWSFSSNLKKRKNYPRANANAPPAPEPVMTSNIESMREPVSSSSRSSKANCNERRMPPPSSDKIRKPYLNLKKFGIDFGWKND